jgi:hypothetical protein
MKNKNCKREKIVKETLNKLLQFYPFINEPKINIFPMDVYGIYWPESIHFRPNGEKVHKEPNINIASNMPIKEVVDTTIHEFGHHVGFVTKKDLSEDFAWNFVKLNTKRIAI